MNEQQPPTPPRARLQVLLAIPERQRTDAEWDELNELEIVLASGNRQGAPDQNQNFRRNMPQSGGGGRPNNQGGGGQQQRGQKPGRKFHQRPPRRNAP
jgi:hypothetical protein